MTCAVVAGGLLWTDAGALGWLVGAALVVPTAAVVLTAAGCAMVELFGLAALLFAGLGVVAVAVVVGMVGVVAVAGAELFVDEEPQPAAMRAMAAAMSNAAALRRRFLIVPRMTPAANDYFPTTLRQGHKLFWPCALR
jgi:hypothetical protein